MMDDIFNYIAEKEKEYLLPVNINDWEWGMHEHCQTTFFYKHGRLLSGQSEDKPVKNITKPLLNLQYRTEDIDVKDILLFVDEPNRFHLSFLIKKYHDDVFVKENNIDTFLDRTNIRNIDYGGVLVENTGEPTPKTIDWNNIAFCDQTDIMSGPIGFRYFFSVDKLKFIGLFTRHTGGKRLLMGLYFYVNAYSNSLLALNKIPEGSRAQKEQVPAIDC